jgi:hypothetical protein
MANSYQPPVADYASPTSLRVRGMSVGDYVFYFFSTVLFMALAGTPLLFFERLKKVFEDFKLKLPASTEALYTIHDLLEDSHAL